MTLQERAEKAVEMKKHRCFIGGYESANKRLLEYNTKKINTTTKVSSISFKDEDINADFDLMRKDTELSVELPESKSINESKSQSKITEI